MLITLKTSLGGVRGGYKAGREYNFAEDDAARLCRKGLATPKDPEALSKAVIALEKKEGAESRAKADAKAKADKAAAEKKVDPEAGALVA